jgi:phage shock protein E
MTSRTGNHSRKPHAGALAAGALVMAVLGPACGGGSAPHDRMNGEGAAPSSRPPSTLLEPADYAARTARPEAVVINVHVPYEGELEGTDAFIHFERIVGDDRLPEDKSTEIFLYCRTGRMSLISAKALRADGYTNLYDLKGGMVAWEASGRSLVHRSPPPGPD